MLTYIQINAAKPREKAWTLSDSQGLLLQIQPNGSKLWRFKYRFLDKQKTLPPASESLTRGPARKSLKSVQGVRALLGTLDTLLGPARVHPRYAIAGLYWRGDRILT